MRFLERFVNQKNMNFVLSQQQMLSYIKHQSLKALKMYLG